MYGDCVLSRERSAQRHLSFDDVAKTNLLSQDSQQHGSTPGKAKLLRFQAPRQGALFPDHYRDIDWVLLGATLFYKPEWIRSALRTGIRAIEGVGDVLPSYWGNIVQCSNGRPFSGSITSLSMTRKGLPRVNGFTL